MGTYVNSLLSDGETIRYEAKLHWIIDIWGYILLPLYGIGLITLFMTYFIKKTSEFVITSKRVVLKTGIISRQAYDIILDKVEGVTVDQGVFGRMLGYGTIIVRGTGGASQPFKNIADPFTFKRMVDEACEARRNTK